MRAGEVILGLVPSMRFPVPLTPVISETEAARLAAVIVLVRFFEPSVVTRREAVRLESVVIPDMRAVPATSSFAPGLAVPIPTLVPLSKI